MQALTSTPFVNLALFLAAATVATMIYRKVAPYLWGHRKGEPIGERIEPVKREQQEKRAIQHNLDMTPQNALRVRLVNSGVMFGFLCFVHLQRARIGHQFMGDAVLYFAGYVIVGLVAWAIVNAVPTDLFAGLNWNSRIDVRLYYVWLWPLNVAKAATRKHQGPKQP